MPPHFTTFFPSFLPPLVTRMQQRHILFSPPTRRGYRKSTANPPPPPYSIRRRFLLLLNMCGLGKGYSPFAPPSPPSTSIPGQTLLPPFLPPHTAAPTERDRSLQRRQQPGSRRALPTPPHARSLRRRWSPSAPVFFSAPPPSRPTTLTPFSPLPSPYLIVSRDEKRREERHLLLPPDVLQSSSLDVTTHDATLSYNVMPIRPSRHSGPTPFITSVTLPACDKSSRECGERKWPKYREQMRPHISK